MRVGALSEEQASNPQDTLSSAARRVMSASVRQVLCMRHSLRLRAAALKKKPHEDPITNGNVSRGGGSICAGDWLLV